jgi:hypothetical protein
MNKQKKKHCSPSLSQSPTLKAHADEASTAAASGMHGSVSLSFRVAERQIEQWFQEPASL